MFSQDELYREDREPPAVRAWAQAEVTGDPLSIIRMATTIGANRGQRPPQLVTDVCAELVASLDTVSPTSVVDTFTETLLTRDVDAALEWLLDVGFIAASMPELSATRELAQEGGRHHKDVWEHTKLVVKQAVRRPTVRWGALLHDIGKVPTRRFTKNGVHFHGHAEVGARMFDRMSSRIPMPRPLKRSVRFLIRHHLRAAQYEPDWSDGAVRRFDREMGESLVDLLDLSRADITSKRPGRRQSLLKQISTLSARIEALRASDAVLPPLLPGVGNDIMTHFSIPPSQVIGDIKRTLESAIAGGELDERRESSYYIEWLAKGGVVANCLAEHQLRVEARPGRRGKSDPSE